MPKSFKTFDTFSTLCIRFGMRNITDMENKVGFNNFFEGCPKSCNEKSGKI